MKSPPVSIEKLARNGSSSTGPRSITNSSGYQNWNNRSDEAGVNDSEWKDLFSYILRELMDVLATTSTDLQASVMPRSRTLDIVKTFDDDQLKQWMDGVWKGVKEKDWTDLCANTYHT